jgi:hypothetical protein
MKEIVGTMLGMKEECVTKKEIITCLCVQKYIH